MVDYDWQDDVTWTYSTMVEAEQLLVLGTDDKATPIKQLPVTTSKKTLGIWTNPAGDCSKQLEVLLEKITTWSGRLLSGKLPAKWAWVSYYHQLWAQLKYGLGCNASPIVELD